LNFIKNSVEAGHGILLGKPWSRLVRLVKFSRHTVSPGPAGRASQAGWPAAQSQSDSRSDPSHGTKAARGPGTVTGKPYVTQGECVPQKITKLSGPAGRMQLTVPGPAAWQHDSVSLRMMINALIIGLPQCQSEDRARATVAQPWPRLECCHVAVPEKRSSQKTTKCQWPSALCRCCLGQVRRASLCPRSS
jgi:hypothetical protein